ncbi:Nse4 C-terminal-domain-containing protein [Amanita rubescens]|nr:Nse4 C-terminal-domain-containing protein [Amanita rubescens]
MPADLIYDPDQNPEEKREVRQNYRNLAKVIDEHQANLNDNSAEVLAKHITHADELFLRVKGPQEAALDSALLLKASSMGAQKARAMKSGSGNFDIDEFVSKLITYMGGRRTLEDQDPDDSDVEQDGDAPLDWERIGRKALAKSHRAPVPSFMLGPLSLEQKKRTTGKRSKLEKNKEDEKKPQELKEEDITRSQNETTKNVLFLSSILENEDGPINLFKLIVNPKDFAQSVENMFYLSFLIRDAKVALEINENGEPVVYMCEQPNDQDYADGLKKRQMVMEFDMTTWRRAIEVFNITESKIPQRPPSHTRLGTQWLG